MNRVSEAVSELIEQRGSSYRVDISVLRPELQDLLLFDLERMNAQFSRNNDTLEIIAPALMIDAHEILSLLRICGLEVEGL